MKKGIILGLLFTVFTVSTLKAQDCESIYKIVENYLVDSDDGRSFVSDGQVYTAFLDNEKAEFNIKLYENILFTNKNHLNNPYWDFKIESSIPVTIQTELDTNKKITGCVVMMIGFLK